MHTLRTEAALPAPRTLAGPLCVTALSLLAAACAPEPLPVGDDPGASKGDLTLPPGTIVGPITPIEPIRPPVINLRCPMLRLPAAPGAFEFDNGGPQGWSMSGLFDGDTNNRIVVMNATPAPWWDRTQAPNPPNTDPINNNLGALWLFTASGFPAGSSGFWREDFSSPDLTNLGGWQARRSFEFRINEGMSFFVPRGITAINAQLIAEVDKCDGTHTLLRQVNAIGQPVFCPVAPGGWVTCRFDLDMSQVATLRRLHIRVFGDTRPAYEGSLFIDSVRAL